MLRALQWERGAAVGARLRGAARRALRPLALGGAMALLARGASPLAAALMAAGMAAGEAAGALAAGALLGALRLPLRESALLPLAGCALALGAEMVAASLHPLRRAARETRASAAAGFALLLPGLAASRGALLPSLQALGCAALSACAAPLFIAALEQRKGRAPAEARLGLALALGGMIAGLRSFAPLLAEVAAALLALAIPRASAAALGGIALAAGGAGLLPTASLALGALAAGAKLWRARWQRALAFASAVLAAALLGGSGALAPQWALCAAAIYLLLPQAALARALPGDAPPCDSERAVEAATQDARRRLRALAAAFGEMAGGCAAPSGAPNEQALICEMRGRLCADCAGYRECWAGEDNRGVRLLCRLIGDALERVDAPVGMRVIYSDGEVPPEILRACRRGRLVPDRLGLLLRDFAERRRSEIKRCATGRLMSVQFAQAQRLLDEMAEREGRARALRGARLDALRGELRAAGLGEVELCACGAGDAEIALSRPEGGWTREELRRACALFDEALGGRYAPEARGEGLAFVRRPRYAAETGACCHSGVAGEVCGDSHLLRMLDASHLVMLISDGMGMGAAAAGESAEVLRLLWRFLEAGLPRELALETANQQMLMRSGEDMFATVDLCVLDLNTGVAELTKLAACRTLVLRGGEAAQLEGGRLPLGILERVQPETHRLRLRPGDVLVMGSDGVMEAMDAQALERRAREGRSAPMQHLSEELVRAAGLSRDAGRADDLTCVCCRVLRARDARTAN